MEVSPKFLWFIQLLMLVVLHVLGEVCPMGGFFYITRRPETQAVSLQREAMFLLSGLAPGAVVSAMLTSVFFMSF